MKARIFKPKYVVDIYRMAIQGMTEKRIAKELKVSSTGFSYWKKLHPSVRYALKTAKEDMKKGNLDDWMEYIKGRLPPKLQEFWNELCAFDNDTTGYGKIQRLMKTKGVRVQQQMLLYSILTCGFNLSKALRKVGISRTTFTRWLETDIQFMELIKEVQEIKKDFFEEGLIRLVRAGDSPATIFANRTLNRDRGYAEKTEHVITGTLQMAPISIGELDLPKEVLSVLAEAIKRKQLENTQTPLLPPTKKIESQIIEENEE